MNTLLDRIRRLFAGAPEKGSRERSGYESSVTEPAVGDSAAALNAGSLSRLMTLIEQTKEGEYACEETLDLLDEYAELTVNNQDAAAIMPLVKGHLEHCVDCTERYEALLRILEEPET